MFLSMEDVLNLETMQQAKLLVSEKKAVQRPVKWVSVIEMPVEDFIRRDELVLTTAIGCEHDPALFQKFVQEVINAGAAGLGVATGRHISYIPDSILYMAKEKSFALLEIPWKVRFSDITEAVLNELNRRHYVSLEDSMEIQQQLLHLFLRGADFSAVAQVVDQHLQAPVIIIDKRGMIKGQSNRADALMEKWEHYLKMESSPFGWEHAHSSPNFYTQIHSLYLSGDTLLQLSVRSASEAQGNLLCLLPRGVSAESFLNKGKIHILEHLATAAALWFLRENSIYETEVRLRGDFVWSLAKGNVDDWGAIVSQAKSFGYNVNLPYVCILGHAENTDSVIRDSGDATEGVTYEHQYHHLVLELESQAIKAGKAIKRQVMTTYQGNEFVIFLEVSLEDVSAVVHAFLEELEKRIHEDYPNLVISWGIGENSAGVRSFSDSFQHARVALNIGRRQKGPGHRSTYSDTDIYRALMSLATHPEMREMTLSTIGVLIDYEEEKGVDLLSTLMSYIRHRGNVSQTSRALYLHRQSLLYRLRKIEQLTKRSLQNPDDLFLLDLSMKMWITGMMQEEQQ